jgi:hypothetical protein
MAPLSGLIGHFLALAPMFHALSLLGAGFSLCFLVRPGYPGPRREPRADDAVLYTLICYSCNNPGANNSSSQIPHPTRRAHPASQLTNHESHLCLSRSGSGVLLGSVGSTQHAAQSTAHQKNTRRTPDTSQHSQVKSSSYSPHKYKITRHQTPEEHHQKHDQKNTRTRAITPNPQKNPVLGEEHRHKHTKPPPRPPSPVCRLYRISKKPALSICIIFYMVLPCARRM